MIKNLELYSDIIPEQLKKSSGEELNEFNSPIPQVIVDEKENENINKHKEQDELFNQIYDSEQKSYLSKNGFLMSGRQKRTLRRQIKKNIIAKNIYINEIGQIKIRKKKK